MSIPAAAAYSGWESSRCPNAELLSQNLARLRLRDQTIGIVLQEISSAHHSLGGGAHLRHVLLVSPVALFERGPRITGSEPLRFSLGERYERTGVSANQALVESATTVFQPV
jgi:hypothetical protein